MVTETWLNSKTDDQLVNIPGYTIYRKDRNTQINGKTKRGGGIAIFINQTLSTNIQALEDSRDKVKTLESLWLLIERKNAKNILLAGVYRPPQGKLKEAIKQLNDGLDKHMTDIAETYVIGDLNVNYKNKKSNLYKKLSFFEKSNNLRQVIQSATRHTKKTSTLIDIIFTNSKYISESGTIDCFLSDHQPIYIVKKKQKTTKQPCEFKGRSYRNYDSALFQADLVNKDWTTYYTEVNVDAAWDHIHSAIIKGADKYCPTRSFKINDYKPPWITNELIEQQKDRDYFYRKAKKTKMQDDWNIAKHLRNTTNDNFRKAKADFIKDQLDNSPDAAKFWRTIKSVYPSKKGETSRNVISLKSEAGENVPESETAHYINNYFTKVGAPKQKHKLTHRKPAPPNQGDRHPDEDSHSLKNEVDAAELLNEALSITLDEGKIIKLLRDINISKSSGMDNISSRLIKDALLVLLPEFVHLLNISLNTGTFPNSWKKAQ